MFRICICSVALHMHLTLHLCSGFKIVSIVPQVTTFKVIVCKSTKQISNNTIESEMKRSEYTVLLSSEIKKKTLKSHWNLHDIYKLKFITYGIRNGKDSRSSRTHNYMRYVPDRWILHKLLIIYSYALIIYYWLF